MTSLVDGFGSWVGRHRLASRFAVVSVLLIGGVFGTIGLMADDGGSSVRPESGLLSCFLDCGSGPQKTWTYSSKLAFATPPETRPETKSGKPDQVLENRENDHGGAAPGNKFPDMMTARVLSGDVGPLGSLIAELLWYLPLVPAALFLSLLIVTFGSCLTSTERSRVVPLLRRRLEIVIPGIVYFLISLIAAYPPPSAWRLLFAGVLIVAIWRVHFLSVRSGERAAIAATSPPSNSLVNKSVIGDLPSPLFALFFVGVAALFVADTRQLYAEMKKGPPRLFPSIISTVNTQPKVLGRIAEVLDVDDIISEGDLRTIRDNLNALTSSKNHNIVSQNLCRAGWYIAIGSLCLFLVVSRAGGGNGWWPVWSVMAAYLSVGLAFGCIYYDYYLLDVARYHLLLETFFVKTPEDVVKAAAKCDECDKVQKTIAKVQGSPASPRIRSMLRSGFFASSVFAQDTPQVSVQSTVPRKSELGVTFTYQFNNGSANIQSELPLFFAYKQPQAEYANPEVVNQCVQNVMTNRLKYTSKYRGDQTDRNAMSSRRFAAFLCDELAKPATSTEDGYSVRVVASADCSGSYGRNKDIVARRIGGAVAEATVVLKAVQETMGERARAEAFSRMKEQLKSVDRQESVPWPESGKCVSEDVRELWEESLDAPQTLGVADRRLELDALRAAKVTVSRKLFDVADHVFMANGLTQKTTLSDMVYFSFVSFTTTGYGDIKAVSGPVRFCVIMENILEILFTAIFFTAGMTAVRQE